MSDQESSKATRKRTSSRASAGGATRSASRAGRMIDQSGPEAVLASLSAWQAKAETWTTNDTCGLYGAPSSASAARQLSLASRLVRLLQCAGSPLYKMTWKVRLTASRRPICALRASVPRTSDSGSTGWPSPVVNDSKGSDYTYANGNHNRPSLKLGGAAKLTAAWPTPTTRDHKDGASDGTAPINALLGRTAWLAAEMGSGGQLNPLHSQWLMGYPWHWSVCGIAAMRKGKR